MSDKNIRGHQSYKKGKPEYTPSPPLPTYVLPSPPSTIEGRETVRLSEMEGDLGEAKEMVMVEDNSGDVGKVNEEGDDRETPLPSLTSRLEKNLAKLLAIEAFLDAYLDDLEWDLEVSEALVATKGYVVAWEEEQWNMLVKVAIPRLRLRTQRLEEKKTAAFASLTNFLSTYVKRSAHLVRKEKSLADQMEYCLRKRDTTKRLEGCM